MPGRQYIARSGLTLSLNATRKSDEGTANMFDGVIENGVEVCCPVHSWSTEDIMAYVSIHDIKLPKQYPKCKSSLDCWSCTAPSGDGAGWFTERYDFLKAEYPELAKELKRRVRVVKDIIEEEVTKTSSDLNAILRDVD